MGADLLGYLVKGPVTFEPTEKQRAAALKHTAKVVGAIEKWRDRGREDAPYNKVPKLARNLATELGGEDEFWAVEFLLDVPADKWFDEFVEFWNSGGGDVRDVHARNDPDDPKQQLMFVGELSWGDEPEGLGYKYLKTAFALGYDKVVGIR